MQDHMIDLISIFLNKNVKRKCSEISKLYEKFYYYVLYIHISIQTFDQIMRNIDDIIIRYVRYIRNLIILALKYIIGIVIFFIS